MKVWHTKKCIQISGGGASRHNSAAAPDVFQGEGRLSN